MFRAHAGIPRRERAAIDIAREHAGDQVEQAVAGDEVLGERRETSALPR